MQHDLTVRQCSISSMFLWQVPIFVQVNDCTVSFPIFAVVKIQIWRLTVDRRVPLCSFCLKLHFGISIEFIYLWLEVFSQLWSLRLQCGCQQAIFNWKHFSVQDNVFHLENKKLLAKLYSLKYKRLLKTCPDILKLVTWKIFQTQFKSRIFGESDHISVEKFKELGIWFS